MSEALEFDERLQAYFDDELEAAERTEIEAKLAEDPDLGERLSDLHFIRTIVAGDLEQQAESVHDARFEQIWDEFDATLNRETRLQQAADERPSVVQRFFALVRPLRMPLATAAVAATVAVIVVKTTDDGDAENNGAVATSDSNEAAFEAPPTGNQDSKAVAPAADPIAQSTAPEPEAMEEIFAQPESNDAEIETIEFGGQSGSIAHIEGLRGTTTVIWVVEDEEPIDSERSL